MLLAVVVVVVVRAGVAGRGPVRVRGRRQGDGGAHRGVHRLQLGVITIWKRGKVSRTWERNTRTFHDRFAGKCSNFCKAFREM